MKVIYDKSADVLKVIFRETTIEDYTEDRSGMIINYDVDDHMISLEICNASKIADNPQQLEHWICD